MATWVPLVLVTTLGVVVANLVRGERLRRAARRPVSWGVPLVAEKGPYADEYGRFGAPAHVVRIALECADHLSALQST